MEGVDLIEKNEVNNDEGNKECEHGSNDLVEENGLESNSSSSVVDSSMELPVEEVSSCDCTSRDGSEVEEKKDCENFEKQVSVLPMPGISNSKTILFTYKVLNSVHCS